MEKLIDRFLRYVSIDTQSDPDSGSRPSSAKELDLLRLLCQELQEMGIDATIDPYGYVMGSLPSNLNEGAGKVPSIGFIAHADTSPDASGSGVRPQIIPDYDGGPIDLKGVEGLQLRPEDFPELTAYRGQTLITTDGTTLLGADDKAGIAEIMHAVQYLCEHPEIPHGKICIGFTPDEEIGRGVICFDVRKFGADYAYTMDGGRIGELEYENFNAAGAEIHIQGQNIHPGEAKGKMKNALLIGMEFQQFLPERERPEYTSGYEGFFHLTDFSGTVEKAEMSYIIRDHDLQKFEEKKRLMQNAAEDINRKYGKGTIELDLNDQYYNMKKMVEPHLHIVKMAMKAMEMEGIIPLVQPIRGGTDGANLSYMGLPCPNIFAGGHNFHGKMEYIPYESMEKASKVILNIIRLFAEGKQD